jgi:hypothetical protein
VNELFTVATGLALGSTLTLIRPQMRLRVGVGSSVVLGSIATIISGEYAIGWEFLLIDIPLVAVCSAAGFSLMRAARRTITFGRLPRSPE